MTPAQTLCFTEVHHFLAGLFEGDLHARRVLSLANATLGVIRTASLAVHTIGHGLALARGLLSKHAIKQVDQLLSNQGIDLDAALRHWVPYVVGPRSSINVAMDWTEFDADGQATLMLSLLTRHGRVTSLVWLTVDKATLKDCRNAYKYQALVRLAAGVMAIALVWWLAIAPALRTLGSAETQQRTLEAELQTMQSLQAQAQMLQAQPAISRDDAVRALQASVTQTLGASAQLNAAGDQATLTLRSTPAEALALWLAQARVNARALPTEVRLTRAVAPSSPSPSPSVQPAAAWSGTLVVSLPAP